jgi:hypothetical protein
MWWCMQVCGAHRYRLVLTGARTRLQTRLTRHCMQHCAPAELFHICRGRRLPAGPRVQFVATDVKPIKKLGGEGGAKRRATKAARGQERKDLQMCQLRHRVCTHHRCQIPERKRGRAKPAEQSRGMQPEAREPKGERKRFKSATCSSTSCPTCMNSPRSAPP